MNEEKKPPKPLTPSQRAEMVHSYERTEKSAEEEPAKVQRGSSIDLER